MQSITLTKENTHTTISLASVLPTVLPTQFPVRRDCGLVLTEATVVASTSLCPTVSSEAHLERRELWLRLEELSNAVDGCWRESESCPGSTVFHRLDTHFPQYRLSLSTSVRTLWTSHITNE